MFVNHYLVDGGEWIRIANGDCHAFKVVHVGEGRELAGCAGRLDE